MENNVQDKWLIVYQGSLLDYNNDALKDSYKNKLVLVTGKKSSPNIDLVKSYICVSDGTNDVKIPIPSLYFDTIKIDGSEYGTKNNILEFAKANGIDISFDINTGAVTIDIKKDILDKIDSIDNKVEQTVYDAKVAELEASIGSKYTKPAEGIPAKDLANEVATNEEVTNAISVVATDLNDKIYSKVDKTDLKDLKYTVNEKSYTYNGLSEATMPQIFTPTEGGKQGQLLQSMGGGAPQWTNLSDIKEAIGINDTILNKINTAIQEIEPLDNDYITIYDKVGTDGTTKVIEANTASIAGSENGLATAQDVRASLPTKLPNPEPLQYSVNGITKTYTGSSAANMQIFTPTEGGKQGQLLQSMGGGAPQWTNLSAIKEAIGFAKDLTGVLEATPEEFTYRPSAGNTSIRDEGAVIRRIKGNTTVWGQCCKNPYLELDKIYNKNQSNASYTNTDGALRITYNSDGNPQGFYFFSTQLKNLVKGHTYIVSIDARVSSVSNVELELYPNYDTVLVFYPNGEWNRYTALYTLTRDTFSKYYYVGINKSPTTTVNAGDYFEFRNAQFIDLTNLFGAGNEPQTYEDFKAIYPDIYPYCEPTIRNVKTTAIETVGFNLFNGEYADLIGGKTYYVGGTDGLGLTFTPNGTESVLNVVLGDSRTFTPTQSGRLYSTNTNTCVHFQHSGIKDGECAEYVKHTLELPEIAEYFPNGMNGNANVWDEINAESAITRWGVVDLGSIDDYTYTGSAFRSSFLKSKMSSVATLGDYNENMICELYDNDRWSNSPYKIQFTVNNGYLWINNPDYTDIDSFKAAMSGVLLYYELAEPIVTPISEPIQLVYDVEDFGTERAIAPENSAPFRADIVYQFNAEGRIRDNGRNIERLEHKIRSYHDDGVKVTIDREIITTKSIIGNNEFRYALPDAPQDVKDDADGTLATEFWVQKNIPTEIATATQKREFEYTAEITPFIPNIMYECNRGPADNETIPIPLLDVPQDGYDHVWMIRFPAIGVSNKLSYPFNIRWKDGTAPRFTTACALELYFKKIGGNVIIGEWKIYR